MPTVIFVCHGNICRSPMLERIIGAAAHEQHIDADISSAGVSTEELGNPIDRRAQQVLHDRGIDTSGHEAHQITADEIRRADLIIAAEDYHLDRMRQMVPEATNLHLFSEYDPAANPGDPLPDPWYGGMEGFHDTLAAIDRATPNILRAIREAG